MIVEKPDFDPDALRAKYRGGELSMEAYRVMLEVVGSHGIIAKDSPLRCCRDEAIRLSALEAVW